MLEPQEDPRPIPGKIGNSLRIVSDDSELSGTEEVIFDDNQLHKTNEMLSYSE